MLLLRPTTYYCNACYLRLLAARSTCRAPCQIQIRSKEEKVTVARRGVLWSDEQKK